MQRKDSPKSEPSIALSEHENTRNVLVILLGWTGANPRHLSKYNNIYDNYEDYIGDMNKTQNNLDNPYKVHIIIKQYTAPTNMVMFNLCLLQSWIIPILDAIKSHRESFGSSSNVIIHSFSTGGTSILCAMNDLINKDRYYRSMQHLLYYDGIIYDSPYLAPLSIKGAVLVMWELLKINILSYFVCFDISTYNDNNLCGCLYIGCKIWYYFIYFIFLILSIVILPIIMIFFCLYVLITCSMDYVCCHDQKLLCSENIRILSCPMLLLGSNTDHINPIKKSIQFVNERMEKIEQYKQRQQQQETDGNEPNEDTTLLSVGGDITFNINDYDAQFIRDTNKYVVFENSEHVKHYQMYPKLYQTEIDQFLDLCLKIKIDS